MENPIYTGQASDDIRSPIYFNMDKQTLAAICANIGVWHDWQKSYAEYVPMFIKEALRGAPWQDWDPRVFHEYFMKSSGQCVSSLRQGYFTNNEKEAIKAQWDEIAPLLQKIALTQHDPQYDIYGELKARIRLCTDYDRRAATNRLIVGLQPHLLCTIVNEHRLSELFALLNTHVAGFDLEWKPTWAENSYQVLQFFKKALNASDSYQVMTYPWQVYEEYDFAKHHKTPDNDMSEDKNAEVSALLQYKKQIILQGPPGTGKTRLAKEIAQGLIGLQTESSSIEITNAEILSTLKDGNSLSTVFGKADYQIAQVNEQGEFIVLKKATGIEGKTAFSTIKEYFKKQRWKETNTSGSDDRRAKAIAKYLFDKRKATASLEESEQYKLIQFHPSYTYEDFVRGILAKPSPDGEGMMYEAEDKVLARFAKEAFDNYIHAQVMGTAVIPAEEQVQSSLERFITHVIEAIDKEGKYPISDNVYIFYVDDRRFKYKGDNWEAHPNGLNMNFSELEKIMAANIWERADIVRLASLNALTRSHATYYANVIEKCRAFLSAVASPTTVASVPLKNYVLIIDEINRANLSSVLGELIYALEYRGKEVDAMYEVNGNSKLVLPPNLFIIGTMNTADRSVGHLDYAIRRRFAFVDVLSQELQDDEEIYFNTEGFKKVSRLFKKNVSNEFVAKDVQIGHSYFIAKKENAADEVGKQQIFRLKMDYEVVPILNEYVKDGVLVGEIDGKDVKQYIQELQSKAS